MENYTRVIFHFDDVHLEDIVTYLKPKIIDIFGEGHWFNGTYITVIGEEYATTRFDGLFDTFICSVDNERFDIVFNLAKISLGFVDCTITDRHARLKKSMHELLDSCKKALKARKEYTDKPNNERVSIDIYQGTERSTGKFKTTVKWSDGEVVTLRADKNTLPIYYIFAYSYCERKYGSNSAFKKYVDRHCIKMDKELIFEDDGIMTSMRIYQYGNGHPAIDLYSRVALLIAAKAYGGVEKLKKVASDALH